MDTSASSSQPILETLRTVEFRLGLKGYNVEEVDEYLEKAAVEAETLHDQLRQVTDRLRQATERVGELENARRRGAETAGAEVADDSLQRTLVLAQKFVEQAQRESEAEAARVVAEAEERAKGMMGQAEDRARKLAADSEDHVRAEVARLETLRANLASDVENMARHLEGERDRLRGALSDVLVWIDTNVQPAKSLMALQGQDPEAAAPRPAVKPPEAPAPRPVATNGGAERVVSQDPSTQVLDLRAAAARPATERS
jgi:cell division initiation protein